MVKRAEDVKKILDDQVAQKPAAANEGRDENGEIANKNGRRVGI